MGEIYTDIGPAEGERARHGARIIIAEGGGAVQNRRYFGYPARGSVMRLYPADAYTYKLTSAPFIISIDLIRRRTNNRSTKSKKDKRQHNREALLKAKAEQLSLL